MNRRNKFIIKRLTINYSKLILGTAIMAIGTCQFLLPNLLSTGGFAGLATIGYYLFDLPIGVLVFLLNVPLFIFSYFKMEKKFFINSLIGTFSLSLFLNLFERYGALTSDRLLACIYGGVLEGLGISLVLKAKGSTGGSDLIANIIRSFTPKFRTGVLITIIDIAVVGLNMLFFKEFEISLYSALAIYLLGKILDIFFEGIGFAKQIYIISSKYDKISEKISKDIGRGVTGLYGKGMYKQEDTLILLCIASRQEVIKIIQLVKSIDPYAFTIVSNAREVIGRGFKIIESTNKK